MLASGTMLAGGGLPKLLPLVSRKRTNLVLITTDTERAESMSCYGNPLPTTPCADVLAEQGVQFFNTYSTSTCTLPGHSSIFTGLFPDTHGVINNNLRLSQKYPTLTQILRKAGYQTAAYLGIWILNKPRGLARGFDILDWRQSSDPPPLHGIRKSGLYINDVIGFLRRMKTGKSPFFLWIHSFDPHVPYLPPGKFSRMFRKPDTPDFDLASKIRGNLENLNGYRPEFPREYMLSQYLGEIRYWDHNFQKIFEVLHESENLDDTLIVYTADHGENVGEDYVYGHQDLNQHVVRIPLILWHPDLLPGRSVQTPVQQTDIVPTILRLLKIRYGQRMFEGKDLVPLIRGDEPEDIHRPVFVINTGYSSAAIIDEGMQLKTVKKPLKPYRAFHSGKIVGSTGSLKFTDSIVDNDFEWQIRKIENNLLFQYSGRITMNEPVSRIEMIIMSLRASGNYSVIIQNLNLSGKTFSWRYRFPRTVKPDTVRKGIPCDFSTMITEFRVKYALRFFASDGNPVYQSPWICCVVTDENGVVAKPTENLLQRIIRLDGNEETEWGRKYAPALDSGNLMDRLDSFLQRNNRLTFQITKPEKPPHGGYLVPGTRDYDDMAPDAIYRICRKMETNGDTEISNRLREELKSLGYAE